MHVAAHAPVQHARGVVSLVPDFGIDVFWQLRDIEMAGPVIPGYCESIAWPEYVRPLATSYKDIIISTAVDYDLLLLIGLFRHAVQCAEHLNKR